MLLHNNTKESCATHEDLSGANTWDQQCDVIVEKLKGIFCHSFFVAVNQSSKQTNY